METIIRLKKTTEKLNRVHAHVEFRCLHTEQDFEEAIALLKRTQADLAKHQRLWLDKFKSNKATNL